MSQPATWPTSRKRFAWFLMAVFVGSSNYAIWQLVNAETGDIVKAWAAPFAVDGMFVFSFLVAIGGNRPVTRAVGYFTSAAFIVLSMVANWSHATSEGASMVAKVITAAFPLAALLIEVMWRLDVDPDYARREAEREAAERKAAKEQARRERAAAMAERDRKLAKPEPAALVAGNDNGLHGHALSDLDGVLAVVERRRHGDLVAGIVRKRVAAGEPLPAVVDSLTGDVEAGIREREPGKGDPKRAAQRVIKPLRDAVTA